MAMKTAFDSSPLHYCTPKKDLIYSKGTLATSKSSTKDVIFTTPNDSSDAKFPSSKQYSSFNLNSLLESDLKFKSPSKLMSIKISESPWISSQKRNVFLGSFFDKSPLANSNYKIKFCESRNQHSSKISSCFGNNLEHRFTKAFELDNKNHSISVGTCSIALAVPNVTSQVQSRALVTPQARIQKKSSLASTAVGKVRKRRRKSEQQLKMLKVEYQRSKNWSKDCIRRMAKATGLSESQVYKWCWDQKKKDGDACAGSVAPSNCGKGFKHKEITDIELGKRWSQSSEFQVDMDGGRILKQLKTN